MIIINDWTIIIYDHVKLRFLNTTFHFRTVFLTFKNCKFGNTKLFTPCIYRKSFFRSISINNNITVNKLQTTTSHLFCNSIWIWLVQKHCFDFSFSLSLRKSVTFSRTGVWHVSHPLKIFVLICFPFFSSRLEEKKV